MLDYRVIYPRRDRTKLAVAHVRDYEADEWDLASRELFGDDKDAAYAKAYALAVEHGLTVEDDRKGHHAYLD
ncbi:hypothetical protein ACOI1H_14610 [Loktanella sp. DJP18]|uniref:hypothetical protein n=1 Tax=Loktanella sp. DJP18 TaxID=3409788 RepID=UPI003BB77EE2